MTLKNIISQCAAIQRISTQIIKNVDKKHSMYNYSTYEYETLVLQQNCLIEQYEKKSKELHKTIQNTKNSIHLYRLTPF